MSLRDTLAYEYEVNCEMHNPSMSNGYYSAFDIQNAFIAGFKKAVEMAQDVVDFNPLFAKYESEFTEMFNNIGILGKEEVD